MSQMLMTIGRGPRSRGVLQSPVVTDNNNGTVTVSAIQQSKPTVTDNNNGTVTMPAAA